MVETQNEAALSSQVENLTVTNPGESAAATSEKSSEEVSAAERSLLQKVIRKGLVDNKNDLEIQRKDPKSPLYSVRSFEALNLKPQLLKGKSFECLCFVLFPESESTYLSSRRLRNGV